MIVTIVLLADVEDGEHELHHVGVPAAVHTLLIQYSTVQYSTTSMNCTLLISYFTLLYLWVSSTRPARPRTIEIEHINITEKLF